MVTLMIVGITWLRDGLERIERWSEQRRGRAMLATIGDDVLKDIGLTRSDVMRETNKWFWIP